EGTEAEADGAEADAKTETGFGLADGGGEGGGGAEESDQGLVHVFLHRVGVIALGLSKAHHDWRGPVTLFPPKQVQIFLLCLKVPMKTVAWMAGRSLGLFRSRVRVRSHSIVPAAGAAILLKCR